MQEDRMLRLEEVAVKLGLSFFSVRTLIDDGKLTSVKTGARTVRVLQSEVDRYVLSLNKAVT